MESAEEDAAIEAEIQRELEKLTDADLESSDSSVLEPSNSNASLSEDENVQVIPEEFDNYIKSLQQQTLAFELDLAECDELLQQSVDITSFRDVSCNDDNLGQDLVGEGESYEELKLKILAEIENNEDEVDSDIEDDINDDPSSEETEDKEQAVILVTDQQVQFRDLLASQRNKLQEQSKKQETHLNQLIEKERHEEEIFEQETETKKQELIQQLEREETRINTERKERHDEEEKQQRIIEKQLEEEMKEQQKKIEELEAKMKREKEEWEQKLKEEQIRQEKKKEMAAVKIQSVFKGYSTRKEYKAEVDKNWTEAQERRRQIRIKQIEEEQKKFEEEEKRQKEREEELKKIEEEKKIKEEKKREEERIKKEEQERKSQEEEERKQREKEEKLKREEEKRRKAEEEKQREEEEKRRKEEEKQRKLEEKRQKEEEERRRKEEEKQKKKEEEERKKREEIERKKREEEEKIRKQEEERQQKLEKERQEKEAKKRMKEEEQQKEMEKIRQEELAKREELSKQEDLERQEDELKKQEEKLKEFLSENSEDKVQTNSSDKMNGNVSHREKKSPRKTVRKSREGLVRESTADSINDFDQDLPKGIKNGVASSVMDGLPTPLENKRLGWIKSCTPWGKVSNEPWKLKASTSKRPARRPSSAKKLTMLQEDVITTAAKVASLRQVTTVELKDLPGNNMSTLGQCTGLQYLKMVNCNLVAIEGLQQCKQLQYLDLKNNKIEYVDLKSLGNIKFIDLSDNMIGVIHGFEGCTDVRWLDLSNNKITRLGGMNGLRRLHTLNLSKNQLINISGLGDTPTIQQLDLSHNHLQEVGDINKLCLLQYLNVSGNSLMEIPDLQNHVLLQDLWLEDNSITSLDGLVQYWLPLMQKLNLSQNSLEDLVSLENLLLLRECDLSNNQVLDGDVFQSSLETCIYLEMLNLCGNPSIESIEDFTRNKLSNSLPRLHQLDDFTISSKEYGTPIKPRNSFEAMCIHQVQMMKDLHQRFKQDLKSHSDTTNLSELCEIYFKFCDKTHKMAEEFRYSHEYGEVSITVPTAPTTPKSGRPRSARSNKVLQDSYMSPKEMFEKALQGGGGKVNGSNGLVRGDNVAVVKPVVTAKLVQNILEDDSTSQKKNRKRNEAAIKIQSAWRGFITRKWYEQAQQELKFDIAVLQELNAAAVKIQATWRGYSLRCLLEKALEFAKLEDDEEFGEVDLGEFDFKEDILDDWKPPATPQLPTSHPVLGKPPSGKKSTPPKIPSLHLGQNPHPHPPPKKAWRGMDSPLSDIQQFQPRPPSSVASDMESHRTVQSKKEEKISEEWGFKDNQTAHHMLQRAKKMKYNAERRKKLSKLDPKQRLILFRKLGETAHYPHVQAPNRKILPRKEYFQERQKEIDNAEREKRIEKNERVSRTFEWLHTQVGDYETSDSYINPNSNQGNRIRSGYGSEGNLPKLNTDLMSGKPVRLVGSPVDLQSVDSVSIQGELAQPRRFSAGSSDSHTRLPPIKGGSAPIGQKRERISWRNPQKNTDIGWGGGKKRVAR